MRGICIGVSNGLSDTRAVDLLMTYLFSVSDGGRIDLGSEKTGEKYDEDNGLLTGHFELRCKFS